MFCFTVFIVCLQSTVKTEVEEEEEEKEAATSKHHLFQ